MRNVYISYDSADGRIRKQISVVPLQVGGLGVFDKQRRCDIEVHPNGLVPNPDIYVNYQIEVIVEKVA